MEIKAIIGLGNPGLKYYYNRHSIGFRILDLLAEKYSDTSWQEKPEMDLTKIIIDGKKIFLIKPTTFMNSSGKVIPFLLKKGIKPENILVVHDEIEFPLGKIKDRFGGSARGHNGLKSIISICGENFYRLRFGVGRPEDKDLVANYVLQNFEEDPIDLINKAVEIIENLIKPSE
jgi:PTH1 family peptidyl-tRNA hydrolase